MDVLKEELDKEYKMIGRKMKLLERIDKITTLGLIILFISFGVGATYFMYVLYKTTNLRNEKAVLYKKKCISNENMVILYINWFTNLCKNDLDYGFYIDDSAYRESMPQHFYEQTYATIGHHFRKDIRKDLVSISLGIDESDHLKCLISTDLKNKSTIKQYMNSHLMEEIKKLNAAFDVENEYEFGAVPWIPPPSIENLFKEYHPSLLYFANILVHLLAPMNNQDTQVLWQDLHITITKQEQERWKLIKPLYEKKSEEIEYFDNHMTYLIGFLAPIWLVVIVVIKLALRRFRREYKRLGQNLEQHKLKIVQYPEKLARLQLKTQQKEFKQRKQERIKKRKAERTREIEQQHVRQKKVTETINKAFDEQNVIEILTKSISEWEKEHQYPFMKRVSKMTNNKKTNKELGQLDFDADVVASREKVLESLQKKSRLSQLDELQQHFSKIDTTHKKTFETRIERLKQKLKKP